MEQIIPKINTEELQEKANEYAQKGAIKTLEDFYTGYNSPYMKALREDIENRAFSSNFELPDIVEKLNEVISIEIDKIANTAIAKTFIPVATELLTRGKKECKLSDIMKEFINLMDFDHDEEDYYEYSIEFYDRHEDSPILKGSFLNVKINNSKKSYDLSFHNKSEYDKKQDKPIYDLMTLPSIENERSSYNQTMKVSLDGGVTLEMPFTKSVLSDPFITYCARLVLANTEITIDVDEFDEGMFPEREHCHC